MKSVLTVMVVLSCSAQLSVQLHTSLIVFWVRWTAVVVCSSAHHTAKSSACMVFDTCLGCGAIHVDQEKGRRYYTTLENTLYQPDLSAYHPACCSIEGEVTEPLIHSAMDTRTQKL